MSRNRAEVPPVGVGFWWVNGPKSAAPGYLGGRADDPVPGSRSYFYRASSVLPFSWQWVTVAEPAGLVPRGTVFWIGLGGGRGLEGMRIGSLPVPEVSHPAVRYTG